MSDELVRRIAAAAARGFYSDGARMVLGDNLYDGTWSEGYVSAWEIGARDVIEALGLRKDECEIRTVPGGRLLGHQRRYVTEWEYDQ